MKKRQRFVQLVKVLLEQRDMDDELRFVCLDCVMTFPEACIPSRRSLCYFAHDSLDYFLGLNNHCEMHYPDAARYIEKWRKVWLPQKASRAERRPKMPSLSFPAALWRCDRNFVVTHAAGGGFEAVGLSADNFVGTDLRSFYDRETEWWAIRAMERALNGETVIKDHHFRGHRWHLVYSPVVEQEEVTGAFCTATLIATQTEHSESPSLSFSHRCTLPPHRHN